MLIPESILKSTFGQDYSSLRPVFDVTNDFLYK